MVKMVLFQTQPTCPTNTQGEDVSVPFAEEPWPLYCTPFTGNIGAESAEIEWDFLTKSSGNDNMAQLGAIA